MPAQVADAGWPEVFGLLFVTKSAAICVASVSMAQRIWLAMLRVGPPVFAVRLVRTITNSYCVPATNWLLGSSSGMCVLKLLLRPLLLDE